MRRKGMKAVLCRLLFGSSSSVTAASAQESYVVGFSAAMTGPAAETYAPMKDAFDAYFRDVNAKGGINGHPVKIIFEDDGAQPSKAAALAKKLISQDKVGPADAGQPFQHLSPGRRRRQTGKRSRFLCRSGVPA